MRVADDMQESGAGGAGDLGAVVDQGSSDSTLPDVRLDEKRIEFRTVVFARHDRGKSNDDAFAFRNEDVASRNLLERNQSHPDVRAVHPDHRGY